MKTASQEEVTSFTLAEPTESAKISAPTPTETLIVQPTKVRIYTQDEIEQKIFNLVETQKNAIIKADPELMASTINPDDPFLMLEAKHLVADQKVSPVSEYDRQIADIGFDGEYYFGTLMQSFVFQGENRSSTELRRYMFENGEAYDMGTAFEKSTVGRVLLSYPKGQASFADSLAETTNEYAEALSGLWQSGFDSTISIKLYQNKNVFLYSIKLSAPDWAGAWYERGESIKTYMYDTAKETYEYLMRHESTHMVLADATNDNAPYWLQEGFATIMPDYVTYDNLEMNRKSVVREAYDTGRLPGVEKHLETNLETITDSFEARLYYGYSSAMVIYLLESTEEESLLELFSQLKSFPYIDLTMAEKVNETQAIFEICFERVLGQTFGDFYAGFDSWLVEQLT